MVQEGAAPIRLNAAVPQFTVPDLVRTAEYYRDVLGFQIAGFWDGEQTTSTPTIPPSFAVVWRDDIEIFFNRATGPVKRERAPGAYDVYVRVTGVDALVAELIRRGAEIVDGPGDRMYEQREVVVRDCNGLILAFGEPSS
ncbi:MAG TPA: VOC family protein [Longimicrobiales bacterium]|nr:VOC family protein [Longimicrobiales bacterium]